MKTKIISLLIVLSLCFASYQFQGCAAGSYTYSKCFKIPTKILKIIDNKIYTVCGVVTVSWTDIWKFDFVADITIDFREGEWHIEGNEIVETTTDSVPVTKFVVNAENVELKPVSE